MKLCIDLGGTNIRFAITKDGKIESKEVYRTNVLDPTENLEQLYAFVGKLDGSIDKIYLCCPGPISEDNTMIVESPNLPGWNNFPFKKMIEEKLNVELIIINDANAATLGEAAKFSQYDNILYFTISTGFGGGFAQKHKIYLGEYNTAFEIKDLIIEKPTNLKYDVLDGLEDFCSGTGIYKLGIINGLDIQETKDVFDLAKQNDKIALEILGFVRETVVKFFRNCCYMLNPGAIIVGGSVVLHNNEFFESIKKEFHNTQDSLILKTKLELADENGESGLLGLISL